jgi:hypothetical protein
MSCKWHIHCKTCNSLHDFFDANYQKDMMVMLISHASEIAGLLPLMKDVQHQWVAVQLSTSYGPVDIKWFHEHHSHVLVPIDEYGRMEE